MSGRKIRPRGLSLLALFCISIVVSTRVSAVSLNFVPSEQTLGVGNQAMVDVVVSELGGTLVGAFDFSVNFEPSIVSFSNSSFGIELGGPAQSIQATLEPGPGTVNFSEVSLVPDLTTVQDGTSDLTLFSITFDALSIGTSPLSFTGGISLDFDFLGDQNGIRIAIDTIGTGSINVVPIPGAIWLMGSALSILVLVGAPGRKRTISA